MKKISKILSLVLALALVLALGTVAFAANSSDADANNGKITVDNPLNGKTYTAHKIFDVTYNEDHTAFSYTITEANEWFADVKAYADVAENGLTLTPAVGVDKTYYVTVSDSFKSASFAQHLQAALEGKNNGITLSAEGTTVVASGLELGYYFVTGTNGALCNLTTTDPETTIHDKNDIPFDKTDNREDVDVGEIVKYEITGKVPDYTGFDTYTYLISDSMSDGLTFNNDVTVTVGDVDVTGACTVLVDPENGNKFTVDIPVMDYAFGAKISVKYSATVNANAVASVEENHATLTYSNDPTHSENTTTTPPDIETVYSAKIVIDKYSAKDETKLANAEFVLYKLEGEKKLYYVWNADEEKVEWIESKTDATVAKTDANGAASFDGLKNGTYYLEEIAAPNGYNLLDAAVEVKVNGAAAIAEVSADLGVLTVTQPVANSTGATLPETGGIGTTIFYIIGGLMAVLAGVLLVTKKRLSKSAG